MIIQGVAIDNRSVFTLIKTDKEYDVPKDTYDPDVFPSAWYIKDLINGKIYPKSNIYKRIYTKKQLFYWARMLAPSRTYPLSFTTLEKRKGKWYSLKENIHA